MNNSAQYDSEELKSKIAKFLDELRKLFAKWSKDRQLRKAARNTPAVFERVEKDISKLQEKVEAMDEQDAIQCDCLRDVADTLAKVTGVLQRGDLKNATPEVVEQTVAAMNKDLDETIAKASQKFTISADTLDEAVKQMYGRDLASLYVTDENGNRKISPDVKIFVDKRDNGQPNDIYLTVMSKIRDSEGKVALDEDGKEIVRPVTAKVTLQKSLSDNETVKLTLEKVGGYITGEGKLHTDNDYYDDFPPAYSKEAWEKAKDVPLEDVLGEALFHATVEYKQARIAKGEQMIADMQSISGTPSKPYKNGEYLCIYEPERGYCIKDRETKNMLCLKYDKEQKALVGTLHRDVDGFESDEGAFEVMRIERGENGRPRFAVMTSPNADKILDSPMAQQYMEKFGIDLEAFNNARYGGSAYKTGGEMLEPAQAKKTAFVLEEEIRKKLRSSTGLDGYEVYANFSGRKKAETFVKIVTPSKSEFIINFDKKGAVKTQLWKEKGEGKKVIPVIKKSGSNKIDKILSKDAFKQPELCACYTVTRECIDLVAELTKDSGLTQSIENMKAKKETNIKLEAQAKAEEWAAIFENAIIATDYRGKAEPDVVLDMISEEIERSTGEYPDARTRQNIKEATDDIIWKLSEHGTIDNFFTKNIIREERQKGVTTEKEAQKVVSVGKNKFSGYSNEEFEATTYGSLDDRMAEMGSHIGGLAEQEAFKKSLFESMQAMGQAENYVGEEDYAHYSNFDEEPLPQSFADAGFDDIPVPEYEQGATFDENGYEPPYEEPIYDEPIYGEPEKTVFAEYKNGSPEEYFEIYEQEGRFFRTVGYTTQEFPETQLADVLNHYSNVLTDTGRQALDSLTPSEPEVVEQSTPETTEHVLGIDRAGGRIVEEDGRYFLNVGSETIREIEPSGLAFALQTMDNLTPDGEAIVKDAQSQFMDEVSQRAKEVIDKPAPAPAPMQTPASLDTYTITAIATEMLEMSDDVSDRYWKLAAEQHKFGSAEEYRSAAMQYIAQNGNEFANAIKGSEIITDTVGKDTLTVEDKEKFTQYGEAAEFREHMFSHDSGTEIAQKLASGATLDEAIYARSKTFEVSASAAELTKGTKTFREWCAEAEANGGRFAPEGAKFLSYSSSNFFGGEKSLVPDTARRATFVCIGDELYPNPMLAYATLSEQTKQKLEEAYDGLSAQRYISEIKPAKVTVNSEGKYELTEKGRTYMDTNKPEREASAVHSVSTPVQQTATVSEPTSEMSAETKQFQKLCAEAETRKGYITPPKDAVFLEYSTKIDGSGSFEQAPMKRASFMYVDGSLYPNPAMTYTSMSKEQTATLAKAFDLPDALPNIQRYISEVKPAKMYIANDGKEGVYTLSEKGTARMQDDKPERKPAKSKQQGIGLD